MAHLLTGENVLVAAKNRLLQLYSRPDAEIVVGFSGGKDSVVCLELAIDAARKANRLPVRAFYFDTEIVLPGVNEFIQRTSERPEVDMTVFVEPNTWRLNSFSRSVPYYKAYDNQFKSNWVSQPVQPKYGRIVDAEDRWFQYIIDLDTMPWDWETQQMYQVDGLRASESHCRRLSIVSSKGHLTRPDPDTQVARCRPIYDWSDKDVWLAIKKFKWDYCETYDRLLQSGVPLNKLRLISPVFGTSGLQALHKARLLWPEWFSRLCKRLDGVSNLVIYGDSVLKPRKMKNETWEQCFHRTCVNSAYSWIAERSIVAMDNALEAHRKHSKLPFPEVHPCLLCPGNKCLGSWKNLAIALYNGDPTCQKVAAIKMLPVRPELVVPNATA